LARLDGAARLIPAPGLLRRPALRREAQSTSALEGTYAPFADVLAANSEDGRHLTAGPHEISPWFEQRRRAILEVGTVCAASERRHSDRYASTS
jgi:hypothetical protein